MTIGQRITRCALIVGSLLLSVGDYYDEPLEGWEPTTVTGKVLQSLVYGYLPAGVGYVLARLNRFLSASLTPHGFYLIWHVTWGILLCATTVGGGHLRQLHQLFLPS